MDKNAKFLKRLSAKELATLTLILKKINDRELDTLNVKKLIGHVDLFRVRVGGLRIIFQATRDKIDILEVARRDEKTYRDY